MQYRDILVGQNGATPLPGTVVGFDAIVKIDDKVLYSTFNDKPIAFKVRQDVGSCSGDVGSGWWGGGERMRAFVARLRTPCAAASSANRGWRGATVTTH